MPANPLEDGSLDDYHLHEVALTSMTVGALKGIEGVTPARGGALEELLRARADVVALPPARPTGRSTFIEQKFAKRPEIVEANTKAFRAGWNYGETSEDFAVSYEIAPAPLAPGTYRQITGNTALSNGLIAASRSSPKPAALPRRVPDYAGILDPRGACGQEGVRRRHVPGRGRDRRGRRRDRRLVRRRARRHRVRRAGRRPQGRDRGARDRARAAAPDPRHPARRPLDGNADEARAVRPADGALRPERREPRAGRRGVDPVAVLRRRDRGGAHRAQVPDPGLPPLRRLPRERLGAMAHP